MPANRNALIRYRTIDNCLRNRFRSWTLEDLIEVCSETLYDYEGLDKGVSKRTIQMDLQLMRSDKLGYNAPIVVVDKKYYTYADPEYSITNIPITDQDLGKLSEAVGFLRQFKGFSHFRELEGMVQKLEDHVQSQQTKESPVIDFEKNENLKGLEYLDQLYQTIIRKESIHMSYQSFKARQPAEFVFHPFLLKEFRNRWFVIGKKSLNEGFLNLAIDRIVSLRTSSVPLIKPDNWNPSDHFKDVIGVSVSPGLSAEEVLLEVNQKHAPYVLTKPFHHSQKVIEKGYHGITISLKVQHNFELEKEILAIGEGIKVLSPERLKRSIKSRLEAGLDRYQSEISGGGLTGMKRRLTHQGTSVMQKVYTQRETQHIKSELTRSLGEDHTTHAVRQVLLKHPRLQRLLMNKNLCKVIDAIDPEAFLVKSVYFNKTPDSNWYVSWHQDIAINVKEKIETDGFKGWTAKEGVISVIPPVAVNQNCFTLRIHLDDADADNGALKVLPGSHKRQFTDHEIGIITSNSQFSLTEAYAGGVHAMKPLLLHASAKSKQAKNRRVIHLEFASQELPGDLEWAERMDLLQLSS